MFDVLAGEKMKLQEFENTARKIWHHIPAGYKEGIDALVIEEGIHTHPEHDDFFTLGECVTETYPSEFGGPDTIRSAVVLYYGSFAQVADDDEAFPWAEEIEETLLHELQHHLEHLAEDDALTDLDYAVEENFKRTEGQPFDPLFFRAGVPISDDVFRVDEDVFVAVESNSPQGFNYEFDWLKSRYRIPIPKSDADVLFIVIEQQMPEVAGELCVVRTHRKSALGTLRAVLLRRGYTVEEVFVEALRA